MPSERHAILEIRGGPFVDTKAAIAPHAELVVGRGAPSDLSVPRDPELSVTHFAVRWDGERCTLRDLRSVRGTTLNGEPVEGETDVASGDWVRAGETDFAVYFEGETPASPESDDDDADDEPTAEEQAEREGARAEREARALKALAVLEGVAGDAQLYALLDGARDPRILELLHENVDEHRSLYEGTEGEAMSDVAPYIVRFVPGSRLLRALVLEGWERRWGVYLTSGLPLRDVRRHFRRFLMVELEDTGEHLYFRYYDPWVLGVFWPAATRQQKDDLLRDMGGFLVEKQGALERLVRDE